MTLCAERDLDLGVDEVTTIHAISQMVLNLVQRRDGDSEKADEVGVLEPAKPFGNVGRGRSSRTADLAAVPVVY